MLFAAVVRQAEDSRAVVYADTSQRTQSDERTVVLTAVVGTDKSTTKTKTTQYFSDINGDGLVDLVSNGKVYFNHLEFDQSGNALPR
jgi:hypothetical protein